MQQELKQLDVKSMGRRIRLVREDRKMTREMLAEKVDLSLIHISEPTRQAEISYAVFCLKKKKKKNADFCLKKKKKKKS